MAAEDRNLVLMERRSKDEGKLDVRIVRVATGRSVAVADRKQGLLRNR